MVGKLLEASACNLLAPMALNFPDKVSDYVNDTHNKQETETI